MTTGQQYPRYKLRYVLIGACGWYANSHDHIAALNKDQYGDMSRKSPRCGSWIRITNRQTGASTKAQVQGEYASDLYCYP